MSSLATQAVSNARKVINLLARYPDLALMDELRRRTDTSLPVRPETVARVAVPCPSDAVNLGLLSALASDLKATSGVGVDILATKSISLAMGFSPVTEIRRSSAAAQLLLGQWIRSFGATADRLAYWSSSFLSWGINFSALVDAWRIWASWRRDTAKGADPAELTVDGIVCGDLVIDTYLRFSPAPHFDVHSPFVLRILWQVCRDIRQGRRYMRRYRPQLYLTSYATYVEYGLPARIALHEGAAVWSFANFSRFGTPLTPDHLVHTADCRTYRSVFDALDRSAQEGAMHLARIALDQRLSGGIDVATSYMRKSAYAGADTLSDADRTSLRGAVVVFLHDFYDSPHVWENLVFTDFWDWICSTIETLQEAGTPFFIKPHPNQIGLGRAVLEQLGQKYPMLRWLLPETNNVALAEAGISCGVTVYGTVAHELAYLKIPSIAAASNPHMAFDFCRTAESREDYVNLLREHGASPIGGDELREQALAFYAIHNNLHRPVEADVCARFANYWKLAERSSGAAGARDPELARAAVDALDELRRSEGYQLVINTLREHIISSGPVGRVVGDRSGGADNTGLLR